MGNPTAVRFDARGKAVAQKHEEGCRSQCCAKAHTRLARPRRTEYRAKKSPAPAIEPDRKALHHDEPDA